MSQMSPPKFKFVLYLDNSKTYINKGQQQVQSVAPSSVVCFADTFDVSSDGSIVFYQTLIAGDKKFKVPVLSYPNGKWHGCVLLDDANEFPVFKGGGRRNNSSPSPMPMSDIGVPSLNSSDNSEDYNSSNETSSDDLSQLNDSFGSGSDNNNNSNGHIYQNTPGQTQYHPNQGMPNPVFANNNGLAMPGIITGSNPQEFKKQKEDWIESEIKQYSKDVALFNINEFLSYIGKKAQNKTYKTTETDVIWACSKLIRNKAIISRKFAEPNIQKILALILPDIMKRQWEGKMAPILQVLQEKEETKNVTAIDLAVWMVQNNY